MDTSLEHDSRNGADSSVIVGREREHAQIQRYLTDSLNGQGRLVLVNGDAGIGKTRAAEQLADTASDSGARVVWSQCYSWEGAPAYWPWIQIIRGVIRDRDRAELLGELGDDGAALAQIVPDLREYLSDLPDLAVLESDQARFRLFDGVATFLTRSATNRPLVLILDDLHWAHTSTLQMLQFLVQVIRTARILVFGTYREVGVDSQHPLSTALGDLLRQPPCRRIELRDLEKADVAEYISTTTGQIASDALVDAVYDRTEGNPFFVTEVVRLLTIEGRLEQDADVSLGRLRVPASVREVVIRWLDRLSEDGRSMLMAASVIGRDVEIPLLERICGLPPDQLLDVLDEALRARLIEEVESAGSIHYRFSHALIQETLYEDLSTTLRRRLHQRTAEAIEHSHDATRTGHAALLAYHYIQSAALGTLDKAIDYSIAAADRSMEQFAWESAVEHYQRAVDALDHSDAPDATLLCRLLLALGEAENLVVFSEAIRVDRSTFRRAAELARQSGSPELLARAALGFAGIETSAAISGLDQVQLLEEAVATLGEGDSPLRVKLLARLSADSWSTGTRSQACVAALSDDAVAMARRLNDPTALAFALTFRQTPTWSPDNLSNRLSETAELVAMHGTVGDPYIAAWGIVFRWRWLMESGDIAAADQALNAFATRAERSRIPILNWSTAVMRCAHALLTGRFLDAERLLKHSQNHWPENTGQYFSQLLQLRAAQGKPGALDDRLLLQFPEYAQRHIRPSFRVFGKIQLLWMDTELGRLDVARAAFDVLAADRFAILGRTGLYYLGSLAMLSEICTTLGDTERARILLEHLEPYADRNLTGDNCAIYFGSGSYYSGLLATTIGAWDLAQHAFDAAISMHQAMGARPYLARTQYAYARMLAQRGRRADNRIVRELLSDALPMATELGMSDLTRRVSILADAFGPPSPPEELEIAEHRLTPRELEILRLIAVGHSNKQISDILFLSVRTVERHITNLYYKIGAQGRAEAMSFAHRRQLD